jgi:hypothetical protein
VQWGYSRAGDPTSGQSVDRILTGRHLQITTGSIGPSTEPRATTGPQEQASSGPASALASVWRRGSGKR